MNRWLFVEPALVETFTVTLITAIKEAYDDLDALT
jgi:hypothetical protein